MFFFILDLNYDHILHCFYDIYTFYLTHMHESLFIFNFSFLIWLIWTTVPNVPLTFSNIISSPRRHESLTFALNQRTFSKVDRVGVALNRLRLLAKSECQTIFQHKLNSQCIPGKFATNDSWRLPAGKCVHMDFKKGIYTNNCSKSATRYSFTYPNIYFFYIKNCYDFGLFNFEIEPATCTFQFYLSNIIKYLA